jgi:lactate dehydrogenase-like 2-hydroxyacid dehydrogenase
MKPEVIVRVPFPAESVALLEEDFVVHYAPTVPELEHAIREFGSRTRAVVTNGSIGLSGDQIRSIPNLEVIHTVGVGFEMIDMAAVKEKQIVVATNSGTNAFSVAEQAVALTLAVLRDIPAADRAVRSGIWEEMRFPRPLIYGKNVGIIGLGEIGLGIAKRMEAFEATVGYHNRKPREDVAYRYYASPKELAEASDILIVSCPGGEATRGIVNREVLQALGSSGILINVGRGSVVSTEDLVEALHSKTIAGAGIDVWVGEPVLPKSLAEAPNLVISPHIGGRSPEAIVFARQQIANNLKAHFFGGEMVHRIA